MKRITLLIALVATMLFTGANMATVSAQESQLDNFTSLGDGLKRGGCLNIDTLDCSSITPDQKINNTIALVVNLFSIGVGVVAVIMIIIGGFKYITSGGDSGNVSGAKNTILYAVIGLVVVALAQFIVRFVLDRALADTGTTGGGAGGA
jgi:hypothetical protein